MVSRPLAAMWAGTVAQIDGELDDLLRAELRRLEGGDGPFPMERIKARRPRAKTAWVSPVRRKAKRVSPKRRKAMQQQGRYIGAVRQLSPADRAKVRGVRAEKGFAAAIAEAHRLMRAS